MPHAGVEVVTNFMQSGTYDIGAEQLEPGFEEMTGIELEIVASPFVVLVQNNITDLSTGTGEFDVISGDFWIGSVWNHMHPLDELIERDMWGGSTSSQVLHAAGSVRVILTASGSAFPIAPMLMA